MTTILTNLVGRSVVSAITQTPASGPLGLVTTPPRSALPTRTVSLLRLARKQSGQRNGQEHGKYDHYSRMQGSFAHSVRPPSTVESRLFQAEHITLQRWRQGRPPSATALPLLLENALRYLHMDAVHWPVDKLCNRDVAGNTNKLVSLVFR